MAKIPKAFPKLDLPVRPPFAPMEAKAVEAIPTGPEWVYEPKWDGFRVLAFRDGATVVLQSKSGQPLHRYFPELVEGLRALPVKRFVIDGEIVILASGKLAFDDLLMRIHPAEKRIRMLAAKTPAKILAFDLLVDHRKRDLTARPFADRRKELEALVIRLGTSPVLELSRLTADRRQAVRWMKEFAGVGCDGIIAKLSPEPYHSGDREAMQKIKRLRTADCVVAGFRYSSGDTGAVGSLLLGVYNSDGELDHIGFAAGFTAKERVELLKKIRPVMGGTGFTGNAPGGPSRWSTDRSSQWEPLKPKLVCEVRYDHFSGGRFRHGTKLLRWRPDKSPRQCTFDQFQ